MHYIYKIIIILNNKIYIGQTQNINKRWSQHKKEASKDKPSMIINSAMKKYGIENCKIEIIDFAQNYWQADCLEQNYIKQYDCHISHGKGYNVSLGGPVAPKSEEWRQMMRDWHASLSPEEKEIRSEMHRQSMINVIATQGHPAQGTKRIPEQVQNLIQARKDHPVIYTEEIRKNMSEAHLGFKASEEAKKKLSESATLAWAKRNTIRLESGELKCNAPNCDVVGQAIYLIIDEVRYCHLHGQRLKRYGSVEERENPLIGHKLSEETKRKCGLANIGKIPVNKIKFTEKQIIQIISDSRPSRAIAKEFGVSQNTILRLKLKI